MLPVLFYSLNKAPYATTADTEDSRAFNNISHRIQHVQTLPVEQTGILKIHINLKSLRLPAVPVNNQLASYICLL